MQVMNNNGPMLNAYPDSVGGTLSDIVGFLNRPEMKDVFQSFYILPSIFNTDLDHGFSVIDYGLNELLASRQDLEDLKAMGIDLKLDFILNHASVLSHPFQDLIKNGDKSKYRDFFIDWNKFWAGHGTMTEEGYIQPDPELIQNMFFRKPGLPFLMVYMPDGNKVPYWNTFYQEVHCDPIDAQDLMHVMDIQYSSAEVLADVVNQALKAGKKFSEISFGRFQKYQPKTMELLKSRIKYLGQMDLNVNSPLVWEYYEDTLKTLAEYGAKIVRLDAFAYTSKKPGRENFLNDPETWEILEKVQGLADQYHLKLLPEIHDSYQKGTYKVLAQKGYLTYDFFLPGLIIDALERRNGDILAKWAHELVDNNIRTVNMLGCHDGIPLLDLKGLIPDEQIETLRDTIIGRGGLVKNLHGQKNMYYQVNATYYSALGEDDQKMLLARALQLFMPGKPQIWYLDLFAGKNDYAAVANAADGGHKEINRSNLSCEQIEQLIKKDVVSKQIEMIKFRNSSPAFGYEAEMTLSHKNGQLEIIWRNHGCEARLKVDLTTYQFEISDLN